MVGVTRFSKLPFLIIAAYAVFVANIALPASSFAGIGAFVQDDADKRFDRAVWLLTQATRARPDGEHIRLLRGLRELSDPDLRPFFSALYQNENPFIRVHALLGLAEISDPARIDAWRLSRLDQTELKRSALGRAISDGHVGVEQYRQILEWPDVDAAIKSVVLVELVARGEGVDRDALRSLMESDPSPIIRARAALALSHLGHTDGTEEALASLQDMPRSVREEALSNLLSLINVEGWTEAAPWVASLLDEPVVSTSLRLEIVRTLITLNPDEGVQYWTEQYAADSGLAHRLRFALLLLSKAEALDPEDFQVVENEDTELLISLGRTGAAVASGSPAVAECMALLRMGHPMSSVWVLSHAGALIENDETKAPGIELLAAVVRDAMEDGGAVNERLELALLASDVLVQTDAARARKILDEARRRQRRLVEEAILAGAWRAQSPEAMQLVSGVDEWLSTRSGSIAVLIRAAFADERSLTPDDLFRLSLVFGGVGRVSPEYQIQAAWIYLRHTGEQGNALAQVLASMPSRQPDINPIEDPSTSSNSNGG